MSAMGGVADETLRSGGGAQRAEVEAPKSGSGSRRSSLELGEGHVGDASRQRRIGLGFDRERERVRRGRLSRAEPVRSSHLGGLTGGPGLSAHFLFLVNGFKPKTFKKNPNLFKNKPEKNTKNKLKIISNYFSSFIGLTPLSEENNFMSHLHKRKRSSYFWLKKY
jgi:hypothetical protein